MHKHDDFPQDDWLRERFDPGPLPDEPFTGDVMQRISENRRRRRLVLTIASGAGLLIAGPGITALWGWGFNLTDTVLVSGTTLTTSSTALSLGIVASLVGVCAIALLESD